MLTDREITALLLQGRLNIYPYSPEYVQPVSYDVHLGTVGKSYPAKTDPQFVDLGEPETLPPMLEFVIPPRESTERLYLRPLEFALACTHERISIAPDVSVELEGKSTLGRIGLFVHVTAGLIDPGWGRSQDAGGRITIELFNASPHNIRLWAGMPIGQIVVHALNMPVARAYGDPTLNSHYQGDDTTQESRGFTK